MKKKSPKNEKEYKDYKQLFEKIKKDSKKKYFQEKLSFYKNDIKNTWKTLKDVIGKTRINEKRLPKNITEKILPKIECKCFKNTPKTTMITNHTCLILQHLAEQELKEAVASLKPNKSPRCDSIHVNVIKAIYKELIF